MALVAATVANGGTLMKPHLVDRHDRQDGHADDRADALARVVDRPTIAAEIAAAMQRGGRGHDRAGCSRPGAKVPGVPTAGKSGTAELGGSGEPHSWFIGFAPCDDPQVAIAVLVESGGRGRAAPSPIAGELMARYLDSIAK